MLEQLIVEKIKENQMSHAFIMMYFYDQVVIGEYKNEKLVIMDDYDESLVYEIHIFNPDKELRGIKENQKYHFYLIEDDEDSDNYFEEHMFLIGNKSVVHNGFTTVTQYGRKMVLPFECDITDGNHRWCLIVRNFFSKTNYSFCGYRLVDIRKDDENEPRTPICESL